jgi:hypothetical protein
MGFFRFDVVKPLRDVTILHNLKTPVQERRSKARIQTGVTRYHRKRRFP